MSDEKRDEAVVAEQPVPVLVPIPTAPVEPVSVTALVDSWAAKWFPESPPFNHPIPYLSGPWHHVREAIAELKQEIQAEAK
jgi:hypothetical protein